MLEESGFEHCHWAPIVDHGCCLCFWDCLLYAGKIPPNSDLTVQQEMKDFGGGAAAVFMFQELCTGELELKKNPAFSP